MVDKTTHRTRLLEFLANGPTTCFGKFGSKTRLRNTYKLPILRLTCKKNIHTVDTRKIPTYSSSFTPFASKKSMLIYGMASTSSITRSLGYRIWCMVYGVWCTKYKASQSRACIARNVSNTYTHRQTHVLLDGNGSPSGADRCGALFADFDMAARALATSFSRLFAIIRERGGGLLISHFSFFILLCNSARN